MSEPDFTLTVTLIHDDWRGWRFGTGTSSHSLEVIDAGRALDVVRAIAPEREAEVKAWIRDDAERLAGKLAEHLEREQKDRAEGAARTVALELSAIRAAREAAELAPEAPA